MTWARPSAEELRVRRAGEREANLALLMASARSAAIAKTAIAAAARRQAVVVEPLTTHAAPKPETYRDQALLDMARDRACLFRWALAGCSGPETTVAAHSNELRHGKGKAQKAADCWSAWGCWSCHAEYDQGKTASKAEKRAAFALAHDRQIEAWRKVAADESEPRRFREAARRALEELERRRTT